MKTPYREDKATEVASLLLKHAGGTINYTKLIKLMYIIERESILRWGYPVTCDDYYSLDNGPILSHTLDNITGNTYSQSPSDHWGKAIIRSGKYDISLKHEVPLKHINRAELQLIDEVYNRYGQMTYSELIDWAHDPKNVPEWQNPQGSRLPITIKAILSHGNYSPEDIALILEELNYAQTFREQFAA